MLYINIDENYEQKGLKYTGSVINWRGTTMETD